VRRCSALYSSCSSLATIAAWFQYSDGAGESAGDTSDVIINDILCAVALLLFGLSEGNKKPRALSQTVVPAVTTF
jgi:hypothetical protein